MDSAVTSSDGVPSAAGVEAVETDAFAVADSPAPGCELMLPGARSWAGRPSIGVDDVRNVLALLNAANIPACVVHVNALRYYGAGRVTSEWDICVPDQRFNDVKRIFEENESYEPAKPVPPVSGSLRHLNPVFKLVGAGFYFLLTPSSRCFVDPRPEYCELSRNGVPYPRMPEFAHALLASQNLSDICDFVDGMDLDETWGEENIGYHDLQVKGRAFAEVQNVELRAQNLSPYNVTVDYRRVWNEIVKGKEGRIGLMEKGRYKTRWRRIKNDTDPRERDRSV